MNFPNGCLQVLPFALIKFYIYNGLEMLHITSRTAICVCYFDPRELGSLETKALKAYFLCQTLMVTTGMRKCGQGFHRRLTQLITKVRNWYQEGSL